MFSPEFVTSARVDERDIVVGLRLNWFRPLPLSCIEELTAVIDGEPGPEGVLLLDGVGHPVDALIDKDDVWWRLASDVELRIPWNGSAEPEQVRVTMRTRIPLLVGPTGAPVVVADTAAVAVAA